MTHERPIFVQDAELPQFRKDHLIVAEKDIFESQCKELARIHKPSGGIGGAAQVELDQALVPQAVNIYFPWQKTLLRCVESSALQTLRTNRNKNFINTLEQEKLAKSKVGIAGMSVGAGIAVALVYSGISDTIKIADHDKLDTSNLNRLRESLLNIGRPKVELAAEHIYEVNPYADVQIFDDGITEENIDKFFADPELSVVIDEIDDFKMKVQLRVAAKLHRIPLVMFTSLGDNILIDIERFDAQPDLPIFHGLLGEVSEEILALSELTPQDIKKYSVQLVGKEYIPTKALQSVAEMGKTLVGRPQLYSTIAVDGGLAAYVVRSIILTGKPDSGRYFVKFNELVGLKNSDFEETDERNEILKRLFSNG